MKKIILFFLVSLMSACAPKPEQNLTDAIRFNSLGYRSDLPKQATILPCLKL